MYGHFCVLRQTNRARARSMVFKARQSFYASLHNFSLAQRLLCFRQYLCQAETVKLNHTHLEQL